MTGVSLCALSLSHMSYFGNMLKIHVDSTLLCRLETAWIGSFFESENAQNRFQSWPMAAPW